MKSPDSRIAAALLAATALAGCGGGLETLPPASGAQAPARGGAVSDTPVLVGEPYTIGGRTYTPSDPAHYDEVGYASYYGAELAGRPTANGEAFAPQGISAAHRTLPLPSYVEVTSLETGRTILVRVNDRGPFASDRIIDLSVGAAQQLGIAGQGTAPVRVRRVSPSEGDRARLRAGMPAEPRLQSSPQLLSALRGRLERGGGIIPRTLPSPDAPARTVDRVPVPAPSGTSGGQPTAPGVSWQQPAPSSPPPPPPAPAASASGTYFVQLGAFSNPGNAQRLASRARSLGAVQVDTSGNIRRVRLGPYASAAEAERALARARAAGFGEARVFRDTGR